MPAWKWMDESIRKGEIGFWVELYVIGDENSETFDRHVPTIGLGQIADLVQMEGHQRRLGLTPRTNAARDPDLDAA